MNSSQLKSALLSGQRVYGTMVASTSPRWVPLLQSMPLDFVFIDTEHITIDREKLSWMCVAYAGVGLPPLVRIPSPDAYTACEVLDGGAAGIIAPYIETAEEVRMLVGAVKFRPLKGRKLVEAVSGRNSLDGPLRDYTIAYSRDRLLIVNIESVPAIEALDEILAVKGLDAVLIGPHDLSCSLGLPEQYEAPEFESAVLEIFQKARAAGIGAGIHSWMSVAREESWCRQGANLIIHSSDIIATYEHLSAEINALRQRLADVLDKRPGIDSTTV